MGNMRDLQYQKYSSGRKTHKGKPFNWGSRFIFVAVISGTAYNYSHRFCIHAPWCLESKCGIVKLDHVFWSTFCCQLTCDLDCVLRVCWNWGSSGGLCSDEAQRALPAVEFDGFMFQCIKCISASQKYTQPCKSASVRLFIWFHQACFAWVILMHGTRWHFFSTVTKAEAPNCHCISYFWLPLVPLKIWLAFACGKPLKRTHSECWLKENWQFQGRMYCWDCFLKCNLLWFYLLVNSVV